MSPQVEGIVDPIERNGKVSGIWDRKKEAIKFFRLLQPTVPKIGSIFTTNFSKR